MPIKLARISVSPLALEPCWAANLSKRMIKKGLPNSSTMSLRQNVQMVNEIVRKPYPDKSNHAAVKLLGNSDRFPFDVSQEILEPKFFRIDPVECECPRRLVNLLANLQVGSWIEVPNVDLGAPPGVYVELAKIAHVRDLSLLATKTQDLAQSKEKMQLGTGMTSAYRDLKVKALSLRFSCVAWWLTIMLFVSFFLLAGIGRSLA